MYSLFGQQEMDLMVMSRGKLAEQYVAQELLAYHGPDLFYCPRDATGTGT